MTNDDIVTRLQAHVFCGGYQCMCESCACLLEAADEIERLREMCEQFAKCAKLFGTQWGSDVVDFRINKKKFLKTWEKYKRGTW